MRDFLAGQQWREEGLLAELRGLRASLPQTDQRAGRRQNTRSATAAPSGTSTASSPRMELPTPAARTSRRPLQESSEENLSLFQEPYITPHQPRPNWQHYSEPKIPPYHMGEGRELP